AFLLRTVLIIAAVLLWTAAGALSVSGVPADPGVAVAELAVAARRAADAHAAALLGAPPEYARLLASVAAAAAAHAYLLTSEGTPS
ncbi:hypothetical protein ABT360_34825, partial [Streptomyces sp. NPDC000229]